MPGVEIHVHVRIGEALGDVHRLLGTEVGLDDQLQLLHPLGLQIMAILSYLDLDQGVLGALCAILAADDRVDIVVHGLELLGFRVGLGFRLLLREILRWHRGIEITGYEMRNTPQQATKRDLNLIIFVYEWSG